MNDEEYAKFIDSLCSNCETETKVEGHQLCSKCYNELLQTDENLEPESSDHEYTFLPENATYEEMIEFEAHQNENQINEWYCVLIDTLPVKKITRDNEESCVICLQNFQEGDQVCEFPCKHEFHTECIDPWLRKNTLCPCCKFDSKSTFYV